VALPQLAVQCNIAIARELADDDAVCLLADGMHHRRETKFEAFMGRCH
jgi:hypothetical protein